MLRYKIKTVGNYQFADVNAKLAGFLRAFGWLVKRNSEHKTPNGEVVVTIRRAVDFAKDGILRQKEKIFCKNYGKAMGVEKTSFIIAQIFTILFMVLSLPVGLLYIVREFFDFLAPITCGIDLAVKGLAMSFLEEGIANNVALSVRFVFLGIGVICLIFAFLNKSIYVKDKGADGFSAGKKKAVAAVQDSLKIGNARVYSIKTDKPYLMTREDRKLRGLEDTIQHAMDSREDEYC